jgi:hypothetical protein
MPPSSSPSSRESKRPTDSELWAALDTAYGCLDLVQHDRKPIDLDDCIAEIKSARDRLAASIDLYEEPDA